MNSEEKKSEKDNTQDLSAGTGGTDPVSEAGGRKAVSETASAASGPEAAASGDFQEIVSPDDIRFMKEAIRQAKKAEKLDEVPIGCVIVQGRKIIARGYNRRNTEKSTLAHAEISAIRKASKKVGDWRLEGCTMYVTLEPCQMCAGALVQSRIDRVVIGAMNPKAGCAGSVLNLLQDERFNHQARVVWGVLGDECSQMLSSFFKKLREKKKAEKKQDGRENIARPSHS